MATGVWRAQGAAWERVVPGCDGGVPGEWVGV